MFGQVAIEFLADIFTGQREDQMVKNQEIASSIDKIHQLQVTAKFCQTSGLQQLVLGVYLIGLSLEVEESQVQSQVQRVAEAGRCDWYKAEEVA